MYVTQKKKKKKSPHGTSDALRGPQHAPVPAAAAAAEAMARRTLHASCRCRTSCSEPPVQALGPAEMSARVSQNATAASYAPRSIGMPLPPSSRPSALRMAVAGVIGVS